MHFERKEFFRVDKKLNKCKDLCLHNIVELPSDGLKPYVDPTNYSNLEEAVEEFANELDPSYIFLEKLIGGGELLFDGIHVHSPSFPE